MQEANHLHALWMIITMIVAFSADWDACLARDDSIKGLAQSQEYWN